jgi:hypothetical protein
MNLCKDWNSWHIRLTKSAPFYAYPGHLQEIKIGPVTLWRTKNVIAKICKYLKKRKNGPFNN